MEGNLFPPQSSVGNHDDEQISNPVILQRRWFFLFGSADYYRILSHLLSAVCSLYQPHKYVIHNVSWRKESNFFFPFSRFIVLIKVTLPQESQSTRTDWTDEKHSLYLKSMEASFVDQLYRSLDLQGSLLQSDCSSDPKSSRQMRVSTRIPSGQFKVHRDGCWAKINFRRDESASNTVDESRDLSANPWIRHFRSGSRHQSVTIPSLQGKTALASTNRFRVSQPDLCSLDSVGSDTEVTDQNFVDEDLEKVVASQKCNVKKMKTSAVASSSNDQVVPFGEFSMTDNDGKLCPSLKE